MDTSFDYLNQVKINVLGDIINKKTWIYRLAKTGQFVREADFNSFKKDGNIITIAVAADIHFNYCNENDLLNEELANTYKCRHWNENAASIKSTIKAMEYGSYCDQTVLLGDTLDYLSEGAIELTKKYIFDVDKNVIAAIGGHDVTREMETGNPDQTSLDSRQKIVQDNWIHDIYYYSRVLKNKVMLIQMDNGCSKYWDHQLPKLQKDLETARKNNYIVLLFQHEPLYLNDPENVVVKAIRTNDGGYMDSRKYIGYNSDSTSQKIYDTIVNSTDVIKGIFCGHTHNDFYTEIITPNGKCIPQYILTANVYDDYAGHLIKITID